MRDICILCGEEADVSNPDSKPPYVHLSCVLKAQPKPECGKELILYISTGRNLWTGSARQRSNHAAYRSGFKAGRSQAR